MFDWGVGQNSSDDRVCVCGGEQRMDEGGNTVGKVRTSEQQYTLQDSIAEADTYTYIDYIGIEQYRIILNMNS